MDLVEIGCEGVDWIHLDQDRDRWRANAIALMMEAVSTSETSVNFYQTTRRNIPDDSHVKM
jgi:hypothetical protein